VIYTGSAAYSDIEVLENGEIGVFFEKEEYKENVFARFSIKWLMKQ
jgi:sialidase-1